MAIFGLAAREGRCRFAALGADYPDDLRGMFDLGYDFPSVQPSEYLMRLSPQLSAQEQAPHGCAVRGGGEADGGGIRRRVCRAPSPSQRVAGRAADGKPKVFRDSAVTGLLSLFDRFRQLNVSSNKELDGLVESAGKVVSGVQPQALRERGKLRQQIRSQLAGVRSVLDELLIYRPRRRIIRAKNCTERGGGGGGRRRGRRVKR